MRKPTDENVFPQLDYISDYLNEGSIFSEIHQKLIKIMTVYVFNGGRMIENEKPTRKPHRSRKLTVGCLAKMENEFANMGN